MFFLLCAASPLLKTKLLKNRSRLGKSFSFPRWPLWSLLLMAGGWRRPPSPVPCGGGRPPASIAHLTRSQYSAFRLFFAQLFRFFGWSEKPASCLAITVHRRVFIAKKKNWGRRRQLEGWFKYGFRFFPLKTEYSYPHHKDKIFSKSSVNVEIFRHFY